jgi:zinc and cadmium transporter
MLNVWLYSLISVGIVSLISIIGVFTLSLRENVLKKFLIYFISFSAGGLFGDAFIHLLPGAVEKYGFTLQMSLYILIGIVVGFLVEKVICWRHCHLPITKTHVHRYAYMNLFGDVVHNFIDGLIVGGSYLAGVPVGIATTVAVVLHEIPQEIGDFGVLIHGGFTRMKAIFYNFITALTAFLGVAIALFLNQYLVGVNAFLIPFAAGSFIYIAGSDLIPELHKEGESNTSFNQIAAFILGIGVMMLLLLLE